MAVNLLPQKLSGARGESVLSLEDQEMEPPER